jgi:hypothetical protein
MDGATVEFSGMVLGECGCCQGSSIYTLDLNSIQASERPVKGKSKAFWVGECPLCGANVRLPADSN